MGEIAGFVGNDQLKEYLRTNKITFTGRFLTANQRRVEERRHAGNGGEESNVSEPDQPQSRGFDDSDDLNSTPAVEVENEPAGDAGYAEQGGLEPISEDVPLTVSARGRGGRRNTSRKVSVSKQLVEPSLSLSDTGHYQKRFENGNFSSMGNNDAHTSLSQPNISLPAATEAEQSSLLIAGPAQDSSGRPKRVSKAPAKFDPSATTTRSTKQNNRGQRSTRSG